MNEPAGSVPASPERARNEGFLRAIVDHVADGIVIVGGDGAVRFANPAAAALFGRSPDELMRQPFGFPLAPHERVEIDVLHRTRGVVVAELRVVEMEWEGEASLLVSLRDITDRREAEERLHRLQEEQVARRRAEQEEVRSRFLARASAVLDASLDLDAVLGRLARLLIAPLDANADEGGTGDGPAAAPALADWCGIDLAVGEDGLDRVALAHRDPVRQPVLEELRRRFPPSRERSYPAAEAILTGRTVHYEVDAEVLARITRSPEHARLLEEVGIATLLALPLVARGDVIGAITLARREGRFSDAEVQLAEDLAQRAALSVCNARLFRDAQEANRAKSDFLAVMSHELRTPLNAIMGYADLLEAGVSGALNEQQRQNVDRISGSSRHLLQIVDEILTFAVLEAGREELHPAAVAVDELVGEVQAMVRPMAESKGLRLAIDLSADGAVLETDPGKLRQILLNLLSNAVKFTEQGEIRVTPHPDGSAYLFEIEDSGPGIPRQHLERIFEPFWQVEQGSTRSSGGTGLGLSVARRLARAMGGDLTADSAPGRGSRFVVRIPQRLAEDRS